MRYVAAYMLAAMGSKGDPTVADVEKILGSVGVEVEAEKVKKVVSELQGKNLEELIEEGEQVDWFLFGDRGDWRRWASTPVFVWGQGKGGQSHTFDWYVFTTRLKPSYKLQ